MKKFKLLVLMLGAAGLLTGCGQENAGVHAELAALVSAVQPKIPAIPGAVVSAPFVYKVGDLADPFSLVRIAEKSNTAAVGQPDQKRPKEPLEAFALNDLSMVGFVNIAGTNHGVINADGRLHKVRAGQHVGKDFGVVRRVTQSEIVIQEMFQNFDGVWKEREVTLVIQDTNEAVKK